MEIRNLTGISFETIYQTFLEAFRDYGVNVNYMDAKKLENRAIKNGYDPEFSAGIFDDDRLVGFTLVGIDLHFIRPSAFDIMTGIIKEYRGQGLAGKMFEEIRTKLIEAGIERFYLEVLKNNEAAIKAYRKTGFSIERELNCYSLQVDHFNSFIKLQIPINFNQVDRSSITDFETFADWLPSWENSFTAMQRIPDELVVISATYSIKKVGLIVYYPALKWIMNLLVDPVYRNMGVGSSLIERVIDGLNREVNEIRLLNVPVFDYSFNDFLINSGFKMFTGQFEMKLQLVPAYQIRNRMTHVSKLS